MNETNGESSPPEEGSIATTDSPTKDITPEATSEGETAATSEGETVATSEEAAPSELPEKTKRSLANPEMQKMIIYLIVMISAALVVVGSLLPWLPGTYINAWSQAGSLADNIDPWSLVVGDLVSGYGLPTFIFGASLLATLILKKSNSCLHLYLASGAFWAVLAFVLGPNTDEKAGVWLALAGSAVGVFVLLTHQLSEWMNEIKTAKNDEEEEEAEEEEAEDPSAIHKRTANAVLATLAGVGAILSTFLWNWIALPSNASDTFLNYFDIDLQISAFDKPLRMTLIIFIWGIIATLGSLIVLQERSYKKPMQNLFKAIRVSWTLAGIAICTVSGGIVLSEVFWGRDSLGSFLEGPFVAFVSGALLLYASRSEWRTDCSS